MAVAPVRVPVVAPSPSATMRPLMPAPALAWLDLSLAPVWSGATPSGGLVAGAALHLKSGLARLAMNGGTAVVLEGPLDAVLDADHRLRLTRGRLTARSSHQTSGFAVVTPTAVVTDVGTEFGVTTSDGAAGHTDVVVLDGVVRVDTAGAATAGPTLHASQACSVSREGVQMSGKLAVATFVRDADFDHRKSVMLAAAAVNRRPDLLINWPGEPDLDRVGVLQGGPIGVQWRAAPAAAVSKAHGEYAAFLDLDGSASSRLSLHGYVGLDGSIGVPGKTLYLSWQSTVERASGGNGGLSLADGDQSVADEQLFVGQAAGSPTFTCQVRSAPHAPVIQLDGDTDKPGTQPLAVDRKTHAWVVRIDFGAAGSRIAVYLDPPHGTEPATPNAVINADRFRFDRVRLVWGPHDYWSLKRVLMGSSFASVLPG